MIKCSTFNEKNCGACLYWQGERTVSNCDVSFSEGAVGKCNNPDSPAYGRGVPVVFNCFSKKDIR